MNKDIEGKDCRIDFVQWLGLSGLITSTLLILIAATSLTRLAEALGECRNRSKT
jgi:hypothetical protein